MSNETLNQGSNNGGLETDRPAFKPAADSTSMSVPSVIPVTVKYVDANEFDGARGGDTRKVAAPAVMPVQPAPRDTTGTKGS
jgi:hypothetical protein